MTEKWGARIRLDGLELLAAHSPKHKLKIWPAQDAGRLLRRFRARRRKALSLSGSMSDRR